MVKNHGSRSEARGRANDGAKLSSTIIPLAGSYYFILVVVLRYRHRRVPDLKLVAAWSSRRQDSTPSIGAPAIPFDLQTLDGRSLNLATFRGKPLVMNFFASWCDPCREEMPLINELAANSIRKGYNVLGVAVEDSRASITEYSKEAKLVFPIALDLNSTVKRSYRIFGPPATFFIDGQGIIRDVVLGPMTPLRAREALKKTGVEGR